MNLHQLKKETYMVKTFFIICNSETKRLVLYSQINLILDTKNWNIDQKDIDEYEEKKKDLIKQTQGKKIPLTLF